jgi:pyruvate-formate lyase-activating enzyme
MRIEKMASLLNVIKTLFRQNIRSRHLQALWHYSTPTKLANLALCEIENRLRVLRTRAMPYTASFETTNTCNLRCPYCPAGKRIYGRDPAMIDLSRVEQMLDELDRYLYIVYLYNKGEPLLHPKIARLIRMVHERRIHTNISTHLNIRDKAVLEEVCDAHLDSMILSIDGSTQETYSKYRVGGDLALCLENIRYLVDYRRRKNLSFPTIEWQFLVFDHNRHEVDAAREMASSLGVDAFLARPGFIPEQVSDNPLDFVSSGCGDLYQTVNMQVDGGITPCCSLLDKKDDFGTISEASIREIRRNERFRLARQLFRRDLVDKLPRDLDHPCLSCPRAQTQPYLARYMQENRHVQLEIGDLSMEGGTMSVRSKE